jgi:hypothetical protein
MRWLWPAGKQISRGALDFESTQCLVNRPMHWAVVNRILA